VSATPKKLRSAFYGLLLLAVLCVLLFAQFAIAGEFVLSLTVLGGAFGFLSAATNPQILFKQVKNPHLWRPVQGTARYFALLMWLCNFGALIVWLTGKI